MGGLTDRLVSHAVASRPHAGGRVSGDAWWVEESHEVVCLGVADGLGHGPEAATAAELALALVRDGPRADLIQALQRVHAGLKTARGAVLSLAHMDAAAGTVTWAGVGNVTCILARPRGKGALRVQGLLPARGVLGRQIPRLVAQRYPIAVGDALIMTTDGVRPEFQDELPELEPLPRAADDILRRFGDPADDALVLLVRYRGTAA
jgi:hypothetical protein